MVDDGDQIKRQCRLGDEWLAVEVFANATRGTYGEGSYRKPCFNAAAVAGVVERHGGTRDRHLKERYGLTSAEVEETLENQGGVCAIRAVDRPPHHVGHDHDSGKVRGVLCFNRNNGSGHFRGDSDTPAAAIDYRAVHRVHDEDARYVPEAQRDPKGTWEPARAEFEAYREHQVRRSHSIFGVPAQRAQGLDRHSSTGRGSP